MGSVVYSNNQSNHDGVKKEEVASGTDGCFNFDRVLVLLIQNLPDSMTPLIGDWVKCHINNLSHYLIVF